MRYVSAFLRDARWDHLVMRATGGPRHRWVSLARLTPAWIC